MSEDGRTGPDEPARDVEGETGKRAKLKIFFGMSAGVGKTYAMLKEAKILLGRGEDVAVGWVESHGRAETDALLEGLERIPPRTIEYRGMRMEEMDLDAALARRPAVLVVDELAHTNVPASRHPKRYQDVLELLGAGVSVYTTVNIQHLESMAESVELFTLVPVRERVPDSIFDRADEVQMVDLPPDELINRLEEGKVYTGEASHEAVRNFFNRENLAILREIALRQASLLAGRQLLEIMRGDSGKPAAVASQLILVALSSSPASESLVRWARRLAYSLKAEWHCVHVETGVESDEKDKDRLERVLGLARGLGAKVSSVPDVDVAAGVLGYARENAVSIIVVGKRGIAERPRPFAGPSITERIIAGSGDIAVFAVQDRPVKEPARARAARRLEASPPGQYAAALAGIAAVTGLNLLLAGHVGYWAASIPYFATISLLALFLDRRPVAAAALLSAALWDVLFIPPRYTFVISRPEDYLILGLYLVLALTSGWATSKLKANQVMLMARERRMALLSELASELAGTSGLNPILAKSMAFLERAFEAESIVFLRGPSGELKAEPEQGWTALDEKASSAARYCFSTGLSSGRGTSTLPVVEWRFSPLETPNGIIGVVGLRAAKGAAWTGEYESFMRTMSRTVSLAIERELLAKEKESAALDRESERLGKLLLDSVSHEMRTPLTVIEGSASALADEETARDEAAREGLLAGIRSAAGRLNGIVENLLAMSRLESGRLGLRREDCDAEELVSAAIAAAASDLEGHELRIGAPRRPRAADEETTPLWCDAGLVVQVLANLLRNAARHGGPGCRIEVEVRSEGSATGFAVFDDGPGVRETELPRLFSKFYRAERAAPGGTGLGLAICKGIVEAHGGTIAARNPSGGGFEVSFRIPAARRQGGAR